MKLCLFSLCNWLWALKSRGANAVDVVCDSGQASCRAQSSLASDLLPAPVISAVAVLCPTQLSHRLEMENFTLLITSSLKGGSQSARTACTRDRESHGPCGEGPHASRLDRRAEPGADRPPPWDKCRNQISAEESTPAWPRATRGPPRGKHLDTLDTLGRPCCVAFIPLLGQGRPLPGRSRTDSGGVPARPAFAFSLRERSVLRFDKDLDK